MTEHDLTTILDECVARVQAGEPVEACLRDYPTYRTELTMLLDAAATLNTLPRPIIHAEARQRGRERMLAQIPPNQAQPVSFWAFLRYARQNLAHLFTKELPTMKLVLRSAVTAVFLLILSTIVVTASQSSLPGDPLYPVKRSWEWVQGSFATTDAASYEAELLDRRYKELQLIIEMGRQVTFELEGWLSQMDDKSFQVANFTVLFNQDTQWLTEQEAGQMVRVALLTQADGTLLAQQVAPSNLPLPQMTATPQPTAAATATPHGCNAGACPTTTLSVTPNCNPANCNTPTVTPTPGCNAGTCPTATSTPCHTQNCVTPSATATVNCHPTNCHTPTPHATATPHGCNAGACPTATATSCPTPNCAPPTATPGCSPANCPTATPTPCDPTHCPPPTATPHGCNAGACPTPTATACPTPSCAPPTPTATPGCHPANCPPATATPCDPTHCPPPTATPHGCNAGACPTPTATPCPTPNCAPPTATASPTPNCHPANCHTPTPTPTHCNTPNCASPTATPEGCHLGVCPTWTPTPHLHEG